MKVFISWSGVRSRMVAEALNDWLPKVIQAVVPFYSADMEKGAQWSTRLDAALEGTSFGIVCLTPENLDSTWIHFEAGALSKLPDSRVWTFLLDLRPGAVEHPLGKFQATVAEKGDVRKLLAAINHQLPVPLAAAVLDEAFEMRWHALDQKLAEAAAAAPDRKPRVVRDQAAILEEMLSLLRGQERRAEFEVQPVDLYSGKRMRVTVRLGGSSVDAEALRSELEPMAEQREIGASQVLGDDWIIAFYSRFSPPDIRHFVQQAAAKVGARLTRIQTFETE
ncbi:MAG TPA: TIR domain-containing protein [Longimicrobium sp.]|nr:TIR domain-containing protein [Longimicrobium sp.]